MSGYGGMLAGELNDGLFQKDAIFDGVPQLAKSFSRLAAYESTDSPIWL